MAEEPTSDKPQRSGIEVGGDVGEAPEGGIEPNTMTVGDETEVEGWEQLGQLAGDAAPTETVEPEADGASDTPEVDSGPPDESAPSSEEKAEDEGEDKGEIDQSLLAQAYEDLGWDEAEVKDYGVARTRAALAKHDQRSLSSLQAQSPQHPAAPPDAPKPAERPEPKLELGELDEDARHQVETLKMWYAERDQQREAEQQQQSEEWQKQQYAQQERAQRDELRVFDRVLNENKDLKTYLGEGDSLDMPQGSSTRRWRDAVYDQACAINMTRSNRGLPPLPVEKATERATNAVFHDQLREIERRKLKQEVADNGRRKTIPPSGKPNDQSRDPEEIMKDREDYYNKHGKVLEHPPPR